MGEIKKMFNFIPGPSHGKSVICYSMLQPASPLESLLYSAMGMSQYSKIDFNLCTHLIYLDYRSTPGSDLTSSTDDQIKALRKTYPHLKVRSKIVHISIKYFHTTIILMKNR